MKEIETTNIEYSIIVLLQERHLEFPEFIKNLYQLFYLRQVSFEIIVIANGTGSFLSSTLDKLNTCNDRLKAFAFSNKTCQSVCLKAGFIQSKGEIIVVGGSYQELTIESYAKLIDSIEDDAHIISPWRQGKVSPTLGHLRAKLLSFTVRKMIRTDLHDLNCMGKIFRRQVLETTNFYGNKYRYLPILATTHGFKTKEVKCERYEKSHDTSSLLKEPGFFTSLLDILTVYFNTRFTKKPLRFFSSIGLSFMTIGFISTCYVFFERFLVDHLIGNRPVLLLAILFMVLGVQVASIGLLGEIIVFINGRQRKEYTIEKKI